jgi:hypothetical protein
MSSRGEWVVRRPRTSAILGLTVALHLLGLVTAWAAEKPVILRGEGAGGGTLTLRLRDVDLVDVYRALHELTAQSFIVDEAVQGRVSVELTRVTLEEALAAVEKSGLASATTGPLRRVGRGRGRPAPPRREPGGGEPMSVVFKDGDVQDVLRLMADVSGIEVRRPEGELGTISMFATDQPWDALFWMVLDSASLRGRREGPRIVVERDPEAAGTPRRASPSPASGARPRAPNPHLVAIEAAELSLVGLVSSGTQWRALIRTPSAQLYFATKAQTGWDFKVDAVDAESLILRMGDGATRRLPLPPLPD